VNARLLAVAKAVAVQVVDVRHVDGVLKHTPVATLKLNLALQGQAEEAIQGSAC
jgi:hypothetical protein